MLKKLAVLVSVLFTVSFAVAQSGGSIKGKMLDKDNGEPLPFANIILMKGGSQAAGTTTDFDGKFTFSALTPGKYDIQAVYVGYQKVSVSNVVVSGGKITFVPDIKASSSAENIDEFVVVEYKVPLISKDQTSSGGTITAEDIKKMPGRSAASIAATVGGVYSQDDGSTNLNVRGARSNSTDVYIDGIKVRGSQNLPKSAIEQVAVVTGGIPAQFGDVTGGVVSITTRGATKDWFGGIEYMTSGVKIGDNVIGLDKFGHNSVKTIQVLAEAERRAYADRSYYLGDPDFTNIPQDKLISDAYVKNRMASFSFKKARPSSEVSHGTIDIVESNETTHYSIIDQFGNAIAVTTTLNSGYGSKLYCKELGFFLNNEMDDFSSKPGVPNVYGLVGAEANSILPEKRMLSSMTPTIVEKDGKLLMSVGTPGGSTIITSVLQTILNVHEFNMTMQEAVNAPRFHHQWLPDMVIFEPDGFPETLKEELKGKGYIINEERTPIIGKVDAIRVLPDGKLEGGADKRGDDAAAGY